jgi:hypothetical protein
MADKSTVKVAMDALIAENWSSTVVDTLFNAMPAMQIFFGRNGMKKGHTGIGIPDSGTLTTGMKAAQIAKRDILSAMVYQPVIHHLLPSEADGKVLDVADNMPTRSAWETNGPEKRVKRPSVKWCEISDPCKIANERIRHTTRTAKGERNGWEAIGSLMQLERNDVLGIHTKRWNDLLWGAYSGTVAPTTGYPSDEDAEKWDSIHSFNYHLASTGTYCGIDRSLAVNKFWRGNTISAATAPIFRDMIRYANYTLTLPTGETGLRSKGYGLDVILVGADLMPYALAEAESRGGQVVLNNTPIPSFGQFGFQNDIVRIDNTWIVYDPTCPAATAVGLNPKTWTVAIHPDANFKQSTPTDQSNNEGGDDATTWTIRTKLMMVCEAPLLNVIWTAVA